MSLSAERSVRWTVPPAAAAQNAIFEIDAIDRSETPTEDQAARRRELVAGLPLVEEYRYTLAALSVLAYAKYQANLRNVRPWFEEQFGRAVDEESADNRPLLNWASQWAAVAASLVRIERRERPALGGEETPWAAAPVPADWLTPGGYLAAMPTALREALVAAAHDANPGVFYRPSSDAAKKYGGVSES
jgi:hypothetical protein